MWQDCASCHAPNKLTGLQSNLQAPSHVLTDAEMVDGEILSLRRLSSDNQAGPFLPQSTKQLISYPQRDGDRHTRWRDFFRERIENVVGREACQQQLAEQICNCSSAAASPVAYEKHARESSTHLKLLRVTISSRYDIGYLEHIPH